MILGNHLGIFCLATSAGIGVILTPVMIALARKWGLVDLPNARKVHRNPIPRIGGVAIALASLIPLIFVAIFKGNIFETAHPGLVVALLAASLSVMLAGLLDDLFNIPAKYKLLILLAAACVFCEAGGVLSEFIFQGKQIFSVGMAAWPLTVLWIVGVTVSINFIDGLDGLAAGMVAMACAVLATASYFGGAPIISIIPLALLGGLLGFLVFNYNPAKIFMGDSGSMFIGFLFAGACVVAQQKIGTTRGIFLPALTLSVPIFDTFFTFVRRGVLQRRSLFSAERGHIHHRLLDIGLCHEHVVLLLYGVTFFGSGVALVSILHSAAATAITATGFCVGLIALFRIAGTAGARSTLTAIRRNRAIARETKRHQRVFEELQLQFREVGTFESWWQHVCQAAQQLDFAKVDLPLVRRDGSTTILRWRRENTDLVLAEANSLTAEVPVPQRRIGQSLRISTEVMVNEFLESAGQRLAMFSRLLSECSPSQLPEAPVKPSPAVPLEQNAKVAPEADTSMADKDLLHAANEFASLRVGIVHDFLYTYAGAERVLEQLIELFPNCDLFSLFDFLPDDKRGFIKNKKVQTTFIQNMPWAKSRHRAYLPLLPLAIEQLDLSGYDIVISSSYMAAKGVLTRPDQLHICYCHTPVRYAWDLQNQYLSQVIGLSRSVKNFFARILLHYIRSWDVSSSNRVDVFVTNSNFVGNRIGKIYRRESQTIYPPVDTEWYALEETKEDFYMTASRLVPYKRVDMIVEAFQKMPDRRLIVVGEGPEMDKIRAIAGDNVKLMGYQSAERLRHYLQHAKAFIFAAEEDFGIVPVEAQACGTPVICYGKGGVIESVIDGKTGVHFQEQTADAIVAAVKRFENLDWNPAEIRQNAQRFSTEEFHRRFAETTRTSWAAFVANRDRKHHSAPQAVSPAAVSATPKSPRLEVSIRDLSDFSLKELPSASTRRLGEAAAAVESTL